MQLPEVSIHPSFTTVCRHTKWRSQASSRSGTPSTSSLRAVASFCSTSASRKQRRSAWSIYCTKISEYWPRSHDTMLLYVKRSRRLDTDADCFQWRCAPELVLWMPQRILQTSLAGTTISQSSSCALSGSWLQTISRLSGGSPMWATRMQHFESDRDILSQALTMRDETMAHN